MTKTASRPGPAPKAAPSPGEPDKEKKEKPKETFRDFVEQIVVAVLLAILIRGFDAEAFVIPTGSMAPTLKGRHREVTCPQCGNVYTVNSSEESEAFLRANPQARANEFAICDNCRFLAPVGEQPSFKGDRILVMKFPYELPFLPGAGGPNRWDVVVFHYPEHPEQNYIKRLVGLSNEELRIEHGDLFVRPLGVDEPFQIARKPLSRLRAMAIPVYEDAHRATLLKDRPEWLRWKTAGGWKEGKDGVFSFAGGEKDQAGGMRYKHLVPDPEQWRQIARNEPLRRPARPTLITDFYSYNASTMSDPSDQTAPWKQTDWVGDLLLDFDLRIDKLDGGTITLELVEAGIKNRCVIDAQAGTAVLYHGDAWPGEGRTLIKRPGRYLWSASPTSTTGSPLWVVGHAEFSDGLPYDDGTGVSALPDGRRPRPGRDLRLGDVGRGERPCPEARYLLYPGPASARLRDRVARLFGRSAAHRSRACGFCINDVPADPTKYGQLMARADLGNAYRVRPGNFLMMGDNSPRSSDSRAWSKGIATGIPTGAPGKSPATC